MLYKEYLDCAKKHLSGSLSLLKSYSADNITDEDVWLELYYLSGYIFEGITVYLTYKLYEWPENKDIQSEYDINFTTITLLDFYRKRTENGIEVFPNIRRRHRLSVEGHSFQDIVNRLLKNNPSFNDTPYIGSGNIDSDIKDLIDNWKPQVRYFYRNQPRASRLPVLNRDIINRLYNTCNKIYNQIIRII